MEKIVSLFVDKKDLNNKFIDCLLIPYKNYSCRSRYELNFNEIKNLLTTKKIYLLCDALISEEKIETLKKDFLDMIKIADKIFFQDFSFIMMAKKYNCLDKLVFYSPTLCVNYQDIKVLQNIGINDFVLSKENTYHDYIEILKNSSSTLGMLSLGYPQLYFSKRKMLSCFQKEYNLSFSFENLFIKEKTRSFYQPIYEDYQGTFIFAGSIFFPFKVLHEFKTLGMEYFLIDPSFISFEMNFAELVHNALNNSLKECEFASNYLMNHQMVNDYGK